VRSLVKTQLTAAMNTRFPPLHCFLLLAAGALAPFYPAGAQTPAAPAPVVEAPVVPYAPKAPAGITLKDAFKGRFVVGAAIRPDQVNGQNPRAAELLAREFNSITAENVMKMGPIHPRPGNEADSYRFEPADQFVEFGLKHDMFIVGHNLCWHSQMPAWMGQPDPGQAELTKEALLQRLKDHIFTVVGRYKGKVRGWDVVNEALADSAAQQGAMPYGLRSDSPFNRLAGREYILLAFQWAHEADPAAELYYNDYNLDVSDFKRANAIELIKYLRENGARVTAVGLQGHYNFAAPTAAKIDETIGRFAALGVQVHITELDVRAFADPGATLTGAVGGGQPPAPAGQAPAAAPGARGGRGPATPTPPLTPAEQEGLSKRYGEIFEVLLRHKAVTRVTFWGLRDPDSWRRQFSPLLFDEAYGRKPAYDGVIHALSKAGK
jgi:endo-1,4-beta-xylanase